MAWYDYDTLDISGTLDSITDFFTGDDWDAYAENVFATMDGLESGDSGWEVFDGDIVSTLSGVTDDASIIDSIGNFLTSLGGVATSIPEPIVKLAANYLLSGSAADAADAIAQATKAYAADLKEAAKPKDVEGPLGKITFDEEKGYTITPSEEVSGLLSAQGKQYDQIGGQLHPLLQDKEKAVSKQAQMMQKAREPGQKRLMSQDANWQQAAGMLGGSGGAERTRGMMQGFGESASQDYLSANNQVNADITNYLNQQNLIYQNMFKGMTTPSGYADISTGNTTGALAAATEGGENLLSAQSNVALGDVARDGSYVETAYDYLGIK